MKTLFFGSSNYCVPLLETLSKETDLLSIITHQDKKVGKEQKITPSATKQFAMDNNIPVLTPSNVNELTDVKDNIISLQPDIAVIADYGMLIPQEIFEIPKFKTVNIHFSQLPQYRGASPVQYTILRGEKSAWITIQMLEQKLDTGDILWQKEVPLDGNETTEILYQKLFEIAADHLLEVLEDYTLRKLKPVEQNEKYATYTRRLTRDDGYIPFSVLKSALQGLEITNSKLTKNEWPRNSVQFESLVNCKSIAIAIERALHAFTPWPGLWTEILMKQFNNPPAGQAGETMKQSGKKRLKILKAHVEHTTFFVPDEVQLEGKKPVSWKQFRQGYHILE